MSTLAVPLHVRWLGSVPYLEALAVQSAIFERGIDQHLLLLEHPHVFTYGPNADLANNLRCDPRNVDAELVEVRRGGDITYHGPGQLIGYPIVNLPAKHGDAGPADNTDYVHGVEQVVIDSLHDLGLHNASRKDGYPGVWLDAQTPVARKICAIGVRVARGSTIRRTMHGFALNVSTDLAYMRDHIVPCGISDYSVTSLQEEGVAASMFDVANIVAKHARMRWGNTASTRHDIAWAHQPDTEGLSISVRKPDWVRPHVNHTSEVLLTKKTLRDLQLVTVCEEAGCPNLSECWKDGTATFMVLGDRCTRACGFCLIDTRKPLAPDANEPARVAEAVKRMNLEFAVLTMVARDDLTDGGMQHVADTIREIRLLNPNAQVEALISDAKGTDSLNVVINERPDVLNHNIETVARLQRTVRPSAGYARSLSVLSRSVAAGITTKSGLMLGLGETKEEVEATLLDLASVGVNIVTIGQYLRPSAEHLPVVRYADPSEFAYYKEYGEYLGIRHVESSPLTRSSYHAKDAHRNSLPLLNA